MWRSPTRPVGAAACALRRRAGAVAARRHAAGAGCAVPARRLGRRAHADPADRDGAGSPSPTLVGAGRRPAGAGRPPARRAPARSMLRVYPPFRSRDEAELRINRARILEVGLRSAQGRGGGTEFDQLREYSVDDEFRRIDWAATARAGKADRPHLPGRAQPDRDHACSTTAG